jgi:hypothetical protein
MARRPKGTVVRFDPDWDPFRMMVGAGFVNLSSALRVQDVGLFNNATDGSWLAVWQTLFSAAQQSALVQNTFSASWALVFKPSLANMSTQVPLIPNGPTGPGVIYFDQNPPGLNFNLFTSLSDPGLWEWSHPWPMCYVPPGYALVTEYVGTLTSGSLGCNTSFMWQWGVKLP